MTWTVDTDILLILPSTLKASRAQLRNFHLSSHWDDEWVDGALRPTAGGGDLQVIGALPDSVALALDLRSTVRTVFIHRDTVGHIQMQRRGDAALVMAHMSAAIQLPHFYGRDPRHSNRYDLVRMLEGERAVLVAVKLVTAGAARSRIDELWVSTGYPLPSNFLARKRWREALTWSGDCRTSGPPAVDGGAPHG